MPELTLRKIAMIGFGEAGSILGADLAASGREVVTYDILLDAPATRTAMLEKARRAGVQAADTFNAAVKDADLVLSAVTAASSADVAQNASKALRAGHPTAWGLSSAAVARGPLRRLRHSPRPSSVRSGSWSVWWRVSRS